MVLGDAVDRIIVAHGAAAVNEYAGGADVVVAVGAHRHGTRRKKGRPVDVAGVQGKVLKAYATDAGAERTRLRFESYSVGHDIDRFSVGTDLECRVDAVNLVDAHIDVGDLGGLETGFLRQDLVNARRQ